MQSWSNISTLSYGKNAILDKTDNKLKKREHFINFLDDLLLKVYDKNCFKEKSDKSNINNQRKVVYKKDTIRASFKNPYNKNHNLK